MESGPIYSAVEGTLLKESFTTTGKNILGALKYLTVTPSADPEKRPDVKFDVNGAVIDILNGANMKGELSLESMDVVNTITNSEKVFTQVHYSITGGTGTNFSTTYDAKFTTSAQVLGQGQALRQAVRLHRGRVRRRGVHPDRHQPRALAPDLQRHHRGHQEF